MGSHPGVTFYYHRNQVRAALAALEEMSIFEEGALGGSVRAWVFMLDGEEVVVHTQLPVSFTYDSDEWWDDSDGLLDLGHHWASFWIEIPLPSDVRLPEAEFQVDANVSVVDLYGRLHLSSPSNAITTFFLRSEGTRRLWADFGSRTAAIAIVEDDDELQWRPFGAEAELRFEAEAGWRKREQLGAYLTSAGVPGIG